MSAQSRVTGRLQANCREHRSQQTRTQARAGTGRRTHATLQSLEFLGRFDVCSSAGRLETGEGSGLEAQVGADALKVGAETQGTAREQTTRQGPTGTSEDALGLAARSRGSGRRAAEDARVDRDRVDGERGGGEDGEGGDFGEHLAWAGIGVGGGR